MGKFKYLTIEERQIIIKMYTQRKKMREIAALFGKSTTAIFKVINAFKMEGRVAPILRQGRPRCTTKRQDRKIQTISNADPTITAPKIQAKLRMESQIDVSADTIRRRLHEDNKHGRVPRKIPFISKVNLRKRMQFYSEHALKPIEYWDSILWTDESMIRLKYSHGRIYVWRKTTEVLSFKCTKPTMKAFEKGIMIWGCMCSAGVGQIVILEGKVTAAVYLKLVQEVLIPEGKRLIGENFILQQDNAPIHKAKLVTKYLKDANVNVLTWPPQSPDLSPIENLWSLLKYRIAEKAPRNLAQLRCYITDIWSQISASECEKYTHSLPTRLARMSERNGGHCGY